MSKDDLLKFANEGKPAEFTKEFKKQLDRTVHSKLFPSKETEILDVTEEEHNENN